MAVHIPPLFKGRLGGVRWGKAPKATVIKLFAEDLSPFRGEHSPPFVVNMSPVRGEPVPFVVSLFYPFVVSPVEPREHLPFIFRQACMFCLAT